jgi:hypothetical protein
LIKSLSSKLDNLRDKIGPKVTRHDVVKAVRSSRDER